MKERGFCGCCSLKTGGMFTGFIATVYNVLLIYWFYSSFSLISPKDELLLVLTVLLDILMFLSAVHIGISLLLIYGVIKNVAELVILWVVVYISSCLVVSGLLTIGLAFLMDKHFLYIILCNTIFVSNVAMTLKLYKDMVEKLKKEPV